MDDPDPDIAAAAGSLVYPLLDFLPEELRLKYNPEKTEEAKQGFQDFVEWARTSGVQGIENLEFPVIFGQGLRGVRAAREIHPFEAVIAVPQKIMMMPRQIEEDPTFKDLFPKYLQLFSAKETDVANYNKVIVYMIHQRRRGKESHLYFTINVVPLEETYPWVTNPEVVQEAADHYVKSELEYAHKRLMYWWDKINKEFFVPNTDPQGGLYLSPVTFQEFAWAYYYVNSRCFGEGMPSLVYSPIIDLLNHASSDNNFHSALIHIGLEQASKKELARKRYSPWSVYADMNKIFPDWGGFVKLTIKRDSTDFTEAVDHKVHNYQHQSDDQADCMATVSAIRLLENKPIVQIWDLPDWQTDRFESSDDVEDYSERAEFQTTLTHLRELIKDPSKVEILESYPKQKTVFQRADDAVPNPEEYAPENFPWYSVDDPEVYLVMWNIYDLCIKAGSEINLCYGPKTNRYLLRHYGFSLPENKFDSLCLRLCKKTHSLDVIYEYLAPEDPRRANFTQEFRCKAHRIDICLIGEIRKRIIKAWHKEGKKDILVKHTASDFDLEVEVLKAYMNIFSYLLETKLQKHAELDRVLQDFRQGKASYAKYAVMLCEYSSYRIAVQQLTYAKLALAILSQYKEKDYEQAVFKQVYMQTTIPVLKDHSPERDFEVRLGLSRYLEQLHYCRKL